MQLYYLSIKNIIHFNVNNNTHNLHCNFYTSYACFFRLVACYFEQNHFIMNETQILQALNEIYIDVLDNEDILLRPETVAADIEEWDSLNHIQLIVAVEKHFGLRFQTSEVQQFKNVGEICDAILNKMP